MNKLAASYYLNDDTLHMARSFLGKVLCTNIDNKLCKGIISETEAYAGIHDKASHAYGNRHTNRTAPMYEDGGIAYVYLIYGMYSLFNIVTAKAGIPHAILIRGIIPLEGLQYMKERRSRTKAKSLSDGPGKVSEALGIHYSDSGESLCNDRIWIEDHNIQPKDNEIVCGPRIGVDYAGDDASLPYRFIFKYPKIV